jgi:hypothetical protein
LKIGGNGFPVAGETGFNVCPLDFLPGLLAADPFNAAPHCNVRAPWQDMQSMGKRKV